MEEQRDPRVFFAAERTLLAWVRTGLTVVGLGFVVARFGLFLRMVSPNAAGRASVLPSSTALGVSFVLLGSAGIAAALVQYVRFCRTLRSADRPEGYWVGAPGWFAGLLSAVGLLLALYLLEQAGAH